MIVRKIAIYCLILTCASCSTTLKHSSNQFSIPENLGAQKFGFELQGAKGVKMSPTEDLSFTPIEKDPIINESYTLNPSLQYGLIDSLEIEVAAGKDKPVFLLTKWQILGEPANSAGQGNFSLALKFGFGLFVSGGELAEHEVKGANPQKRMWTVDSGTWHYESIIGYRLLDDLLFYGGYFLEEYSYQLAFTDGISDVLKYFGKNRGPHLGIAFISLPLTIKINVAKTHYEIPSNYQEISSTYFGASLGMVF